MTEYNGVERSTTEHLRQLLNERGVKWEALSDQQEGEYTITATRWHDGESGLLTMCISEPHGDTWDFFWLPTPEQAVAATLGRGTCKFEYTLADNGWADHTCSECGYVENLDVHVGLGWHYCPNCGREIVE